MQIILLLRKEGDHRDLHHFQSQTADAARKGLNNGNLLCQIENWCLHIQYNEKLSSNALWPIPTLFAAYCVRRVQSFVICITATGRTGSEVKSHVAAAATVLPTRNLFFGIMRTRLSSVRFTPIELGIFFCNLLLFTWNLVSKSAAWFGSKGVSLSLG